MVRFSSKGGDMANHFGEISHLQWLWLSFSLDFLFGLLTITISYEKYEK